MPLLMRLDASPLCPRHLTIMKPGILTFGNCGSSDAYLCTQADCAYYYNIIHGYCMHALGGYGEDDMRRRRLCGIDRFPMYIAAMDPNHELIWRCAQDGCNGSLAERRGADVTESFDDS